MPTERNELFVVDINYNKQETVGGDVTHHVTIRHSHSGLHISVGWVMTQLANRMDLYGFQFNCCLEAAG